MSARTRVPSSEARTHYALALGGLSIATSEFAAMGLLPSIARDFRVDAATSGHLVSAYALGVVFGAPVLAVVTARMMRRTLLVVLLLSSVFANGLSALAPNYTALLACRFLSGLPHGAYFGIAVIMAASIVPAPERTRAVGRVLLGLSIATTFGAPLTTMLGEAWGWRWGFAAIATLALTATGLIFSLAPQSRPDMGASPLRELGALRRVQVWLTLAIGAVGFGGVFAVYTYLVSTLQLVTGVSAAWVPAILGAFGLGMIASTLIVSRIRVRPWSAAILLLWMSLALALYPLAARHGAWVSIDVFAIGMSGALGTILQARLMDVAGDAQSLAASLNHVAFNAANALGPWLGGMAIAAGYGWTSTGLVGSGLALAGLLVWVLSRALSLPKLSSAR